MTVKEDVRTVLGCTQHDLCQDHCFAGFVDRLPAWAAPDGEVVIPDPQRVAA